MNGLGDNACGTLFEQASAQKKLEIKGVFFIFYFLFDAAQCPGRRSGAALDGSATHVFPLFSV
jgi:hypothetical protein